MANKGIRGITIEIGGNTVGLQKALQDVNTKSKDLQGELRQVDRLLKFDPGNSELLAQKQQLLAEQVQNTTEKLNRLKQAQSQVEQQFQNGQIGAEQYRAFQREIVATEGSLNGLKEKLAQVGDGSSVNAVKQDLSQVSKEADAAIESVKGLGGELAGLVAGLAAGGGIAGAIESALDTSSLNTKIEISMEVPEESKQSVRDAINTVSSYGVDAEAALEGVRRQWALNKDASDEANAAVVQGAATIAASYSGIDFSELIQETNEIAKELNISNEEALGLTNSLLKMGFPPEQLDIIAEYGKQLHDAGFSAQEVQAIMAAGVETGTWNIDNLLDGLKEGRIKLAEFGQAVPKATAELLANTGISTQQLQEWGKAVAQGGETGRQAMQEVATALLSVKDETTRNALGVQFFGTMWEDQGTNITDTILNMDQHLMSAKQNQDQLNASTAQLNADPAIQMRQAFTDLKAALDPLLLTVASLISKVAEWISNNPTLAATIATIVTAIGILVGVCMALAPIFITLTGAAATFGIGIGAIVGIVVGVVAAISALVAAGIAVYQNWDEIKAKAVEIWSSIAQFFSNTWEGIKSLATTVWNGIKDFFAEWGTTILAVITGPIGLLVLLIAEKWDSIKAGAEAVWNAITETVMAIINSFVGTAIQIFNGMKDGLSKLFEGLKQFFQTIWDVIKNIFLGAILLIVDLVTGDFEGMKKDTTAIFENLKNDFSKIWEAVKKIFSGALETIKGFVTTSWNSIKSFTSTTWESIKSAISLIWDSIKNSISTIVTTIKTIIQSKFEEYKKSISDKMTAAKNKIVEIWNAVQEFFSDIDLYDIGSDIMEGLFDGISSMAHRLYEKAREIADNIKDTIRDALDIHSPSREARWIGNMWGMGMELGLEDMIPNIVAMANKLAQAVIPDLPTGQSLQAMEHQAIQRSLEVSVANNQPINITVVSELDGYEVSRNQYPYINGMMGEAVQRGSRILGVKGNG
jgi:phage-related minor tail protein